MAREAGCQRRLLRADTGRTAIGTVERGHSRGDVVWPAQFAANGWILDLSDRFTDDMKNNYLAGPLGAVQYEGKMWGVPWFTDAGMFYYRKDLLEKNGFSEPPEPGRR